MGVDRQPRRLLVSKGTTRSQSNRNAPTPGNAGAALPGERVFEQSNATRVKAVVERCDPLSRRLAT